MMSGMTMGALIGLVLGVAGFFAMRILAGRVELEETKTVLRMAAIVDIALFPVLGAFVGGLLLGD